MKNESIRLSVEELALAFNQVGQPESGKNLMLAQLDPKMNQAEAAARIISAGHSLMARGWLEINKDGGVVLADPINRVAKLLSKPDLTIRFTLSKPGGEDNQTYHTGQGGVFKHQIQSGIIHVITELANSEAIVRDGMDYFKLKEAKPFSCSADELPSEVLQKVKDMTDPTEIEGQLKQAGAADSTCKILAKDIAVTQFRGVILRIDYDARGMPISDQGLLLFRGTERLWLMRMVTKNDQGFVILIAGTEQNFRNELGSLFTLK